jgi:hypothetical protein
VAVQSALGVVLGVVEAVETESALSEVVLIDLAQ